MKAIGKVLGVMFLFFFVTFYGQDIVLDIVIPQNRWGSNERMLVEIVWLIILYFTFIAGLITCFVLYVLAKMQEDKKEIIALIKQQASNE